jgi:hypothetical protein
MGKEFEIRREVELPATPEEVWEAVATGPGTASWLFPEEPGPNDLVESDRPHRYAVRTEGEGGYFNAVEFVIEAREGGTAVLRYVHSGVFEEEGWDDQFDAVDGHTEFYLHTLGQYLEHCAPRTATYVGGGGVVDYTNDKFLGVRLTPPNVNCVRVGKPGSRPRRRILARGRLTTPGQDSSTKPQCRPG